MALALSPAKAAPLIAPPPRRGRPMRRRWRGAGADRTAALDMPVTFAPTHRDGCEMAVEPGGSAGGGRPGGKADAAQPARRPPCVVLPRAPWDRGRQAQPGDRRRLRAEGAHGREVRVGDLRDP
jgi:hypothetical protein